jgi:hypothetical protein
MPLVSFKDLCLDASPGPGGALALARFWARVLGARPVDQRDGSARLEPRPGGAPAELIWVDPVPEPRTGGTRVHLDLRLPASDPQPFVDAGATLKRSPDAEIGWWVLADPEGNEFCAFPPRDGEPDGVFELVVAAADPLAQARWWASVAGGEATAAEHGGADVVGAAGFPWKYWVFDAVPWAKRVKNRMHWDVTLAGTDPEPLIAAGATLLRPPADGLPWWVLADPEGNEFCAFAAKAG